jgi:hypothetical protein
MLACYPAFGGSWLAPFVPELSITVVLAMVSLAAAAGAYTGVVPNLTANYPEGCYMITQLGWVDGNTTNGRDEGWDYTAGTPCQPGVIELDFVNSALGSGRWMDDYRAPLGPTTNGPDIWPLKAYIPDMTDPGTGQTLHYDANFGLVGWFQAGFGIPTSGWLSDKSFAFFDGDVRSTWFTQTPLWVSPHGVTGSISSPNWTTGSSRFFLPDGGTHYFTVVIAPEPGSMLAMLSGLVGLVGFGVRRRR